MKNRTSRCALVIPLGIALALLLPVPPAHAGKMERAAKCATKGDAKVSKGIAKKVVKKAIKKYEIADLVDEGAIKHARKEVYGFLKWKLGNPSAICAQYVTAGQKHFNKGYRDEAAAALLGFDLPSEKHARAMFQLPPELVEFWAMTEKLQNTGKAYALQKYYGIPAPLTKQLLDAQTDLTAKTVKRIGFNIPKKYDFPNQMVLATIEAKRNPAEAKRKLQLVVDEASRMTGSSISASPAAGTAPSAEPDDPDALDEEADEEDEEEDAPKKKRK